MSTSYLLNTVRLGSHLYKPGTKLDSTLDPTTAIAAAGGMLWPSSDAAVAAAAVLAQASAARGGELDEMGSIMMGGAFASLRGTSGGADIAVADAGNYFTTDTVEAALQQLGAGSAGAGAGIVKQSATITQAADLAGLGAGAKTFDKNIGAALPAGARYVIVTAENVTDFDDATHGTFALVVGTSAGGNQVGTSMNVAAGQSGFPKAFTAGASAGFLLAPLASAQLSVRITSSVDLNTATAGAVTVKAFFINLA
jgi:hypothetical protein